jgi:CRP/FNR family cyclic AMP-dependent transcriptional regulator
MRSTENAAFLWALTPDELDALTELGRRQRYPKGAPLFVEGEQSDRVLAILDGRVKVSLVTADGKEVVLAVRGPGDLLGELAFIDGEPRSATATALDPVSSVVVAAADFTKFLEGHPRVALLLLRMVSRRLRDADNKRADFAAFDTVGRVASRLLELAERFGESAGADGILIALPLTQEELAGWTGSSREAVSKALSTLRSVGFIETRRRAITILDAEGLRKRAV